MLHLTPGFLKYGAQSHFGGLSDKLKPSGHGRNEISMMETGMSVFMRLSTDRCRLMDACDVLTEYVKFSHVFPSSCMPWCCPNSPELWGAITVCTSAGYAYPYPPTIIAGIRNVSPLKCAILTTDKQWYWYPSFTPGNWLSQKQIFRELAAIFDCVCSRIWKSDEMILGVRIILCWSEKVVPDNRSGDSHQRWNLQPFQLCCLPLQL